MTRSSNFRAPVALVSLVVLMTSGCAITSGSNPVESEPFGGNEIVQDTTDRRLSELPVPSSVSEVSWTWNAPEDSSVEEILSAPTGAVLHLSDGAARIDPATGEHLWSYRVAGSVADVAISPDGSHTVVSANDWATVLDTDSGEELQVFEHGNGGEESLTLEEAGLVTDIGMVSASEDSGDITVELTPWEGHGDGWSSTPSACPSGEGLLKIEQGLVTPTRVVLVHSCGEGHEALTGFDPDTGDELWRLDSGKDFEFEGSYSYAAAGEVAVHETFAPLRGTTVFDLAEGEVISEEVPDELDNDFLRVLPDGYLAARRYDSPEGGTLVDYESREFRGEIREVTTADAEDVGAVLHHFLPLEGAFLKLTADSETEEGPVISVFNWGETGAEAELNLPVEIDIYSNTTGFAQSDLALGPGTFEAVPGAVMIRDHPSQGPTRKIVGLT